MKKRSVLVSAIAACIGFGVFDVSSGRAAAPAYTPAMRAAIAGAIKEGSLNVTWGNILGGADGVREMERLVNQKFGTHLKFIYTPGPSQPEMAGRIAQEAAAGRPASTDLFGTSMAPDNAALFQTIDWRQYVPGLPANVMRFDKRGVAYATVLWGITYNTNLVPKDKAPKSLNDLLKPEWQGKIAVRVTSTDTGFLALPDVLGSKGVISYYRALLAQAGGFVRCGSEERISSGEFLFFFPDCGTGRLLAMHGAPVGQVIPVEGGAVFDWLAAIPKNAPHPNAARLYIAFLLTHEGQNFVWQAMGADSELLPGSRMRAIVDGYKARGIKIYNTYDVLQHYPKLVDTSQKALAQMLQQAANK
jgi:ABC-type Fe3+ transport system substrate-binding protein